MPRGFGWFNSLLWHVPLTTNFALKAWQKLSETEEAVGNPMFLKEIIDKKNCLIEQMISAIYVMAYFASLRGYQVLWKVKKKLVSKEIFFMFVISMINLFPKHKFAFLQICTRNNSSVWEMLLSFITFVHFYPDLDFHCFKIDIFPSPSQRSCILLHV